MKGSEQSECEYQRVHVHTTKGVHRKVLLLLT